MPDLTRDEIVYLLREHIAILGRMLAQTPMPEKFTIQKQLDRINELFGEIK